MRLPWAVFPFDYSYALEGRKSPDRLPKLVETHRAALAALRERHAGPIVLVGKSLGGRIGCHVALAEPVEAVVCLGYPNHMWTTSWQALFSF